MVPQKPGKLLRHFARERFLVLGFEKDIVAQPHDTLRRVFEFLGVDTGWRVDDAAQPVFEGPERKWLEDEVWIPAVEDSGGLGEELRQFDGVSYRRLVDRATVQTLREIYAADQAELFELLG